MSWASSRRTTRTDDTAYSSMGLFNVNMPMLYGEGEKAVVRLQEEIIKVSDDHTIFIWGSEFRGSHRTKELGERYSGHNRMRIYVSPTSPPAQPRNKTKHA
jgi:hypothetical protein